MVPDWVHEVLPERDGLAQAERAGCPDSGLWCEGWTVRDVLIHNTGNVDEFTRVLEAHMRHHPVPNEASRSGTPATGR
jgi:hypothetical protein